MSPADLEEAVLWGAASELNEKVVADYVRTIYDRGKGTKKQRVDGCNAILLMGTVGFAFYNWARKRGCSLGNSKEQNVVVPKTKSKRRSSKR